MENVEKTVEDVVDVNEIDVVAQKTEKNDMKDKAKKVLNSSKNLISKCGKKPSTIIAVVVLIVLIALSYGYKTYRQKVDIGQEGVKAKVQKFITDNVPENVKAEIKDISKEGHLYKINVTVDSQEVPLFVTLDGKKMIQNPIDLDQAPADTNNQAQVPEKAEAEVKNDVPVVDLFVMSYCPFGLQMERGILPVVEALGNKIKFNLKFVSYTLHGQKEVDENLNQYCIEKTQPTKLDNYLKCFWKDSKGASAACMKSTGINAAQVSTCLKQANEQFKPTEKAFDINKEENVKFGVQGSPTLVVNGTTVASGRDSASILKVVCSGFANQPKECEKKLSATAPGAGFDDQISAAPSSGSDGAACGK